MSRVPLSESKRNALTIIARADPAVGVNALGLSRALSFDAGRSQRLLATLKDEGLVAPLYKKDRMVYYVLTPRALAGMDARKPVTGVGPTSVMEMPVYVPPPRKSPMRPGAEDFLSHPSRGSFKT